MAAPFDSAERAPHSDGAANLSLDAGVAAAGSCCQAVFIVIKSRACHFEEIQLGVMSIREIA